MYFVGELHDCNPCATFDDYSIESFFRLTPILIYSKQVMKTDFLFCSSSSSRSCNSLEKIMLNIQFGSSEFNLPYALTKTIGEVSYKFKFIFNNNKNKQRRRLRVSRGSRSGYSAAKLFSVNCTYFMNVT